MMSVEQNNTNPLVSIIIPCFNAERWIGEAIESALTQTYPNIEIIVINDGSTDNSLNVIKEYESVIQIFSTNKSGACSARNTGIEKSRGEFIQFLDADDILDKNKIKIQVERLGNEKARAIAMAEWYQFVNNIDEVNKEWRNDWHDYGQPLGWLLDSANQSSMMAPHAWLVPRSIIDRAGKWNESLIINQDGEFFCRVILNSTKIIFCENARVYYRTLVPESITSYRQDKLESLYRSILLISDHLLLFEDSLRTRKASAILLQAVAFHSYPDKLVLLSKIESSINKLGDVGMKPWKLVRRGGKLYQWLEDTVGWKYAKRIRSSIKFVS